MTGLRLIEATIDLVRDENNVLGLDYKVVARDLDPKALATLGRALDCGATPEELAIALLTRATEHVVVRDRVPTVEGEPT